MAKFYTTVDPGLKTMQEDMLGEFGDTVSEVLDELVMEVAGRLHDEIADATRPVTSVEITRAATLVNALVSDWMVRSNLTIWKQTVADRFKMIELTQELQDMGSNARLETIDGEE